MSKRITLIVGLFTVACNPGTTAETATLGDSAGGTESPSGTLSATDGVPTSGMSASNSEGPDGTASNSESDTNVTASNSESAGDPSSASASASASDSSASDGSAGSTGAVSDSSAGSSDSVSASGTTSAGGTDPSGDPSAGEGGSVSDSDGDGCVPADCNGAIYECGDCDDNDGDGMKDCDDPDCFGPCDDSESELGSPLERKDPCKQDCYFDGNGGQGGADCQWNLKCDKKEPDPFYCPYNGWDPNPEDPLDLGKCVDGDAATCKDHCAAPKGCDCFGCCMIDGVARFIGSPGCTLEDPENTCAECTQQEWCISHCDDGINCFPDPEQSTCPAPQ